MAAHPLGQVLGHSAPACAPTSSLLQSHGVVGPPGPSCACLCPGGSVCPQDGWEPSPGFLALWSLWRKAVRGCTCSLTPLWTRWGGSLVPHPRGGGRPCHYACMMGEEAGTGKAQQPTRVCRSGRACLPARHSCVPTSILGNPLPYPGLGRELQPSLPGDLRGFCASLVLTFIWWESLP